MTFSTRKISLR